MKTIGVAIIIFTLLSLLTIWFVFNDGKNVSERKAHQSMRFRAAVVLPNSINDNGWSEGGYMGIKLVERQLGAYVEYIEKGNEKTEKDLYDTLRKYAEEQYDCIVGHGGQYQSLFNRMADEFRQIRFIIISGYGGGNNKNLGTLNFRNNEISYCLGVVAALKTRSNKISFIGGHNYPQIAQSVKMLKKGALSTNPDVQVEVSWIGSWHDAAKAKKIALSHIEAGVDILVLDAEPATDAVHSIARKNGVKIIAASMDRYQLDPDIIITSSIRDIPQLILYGVTLVRKGQWEGKSYILGFSEGVLDLAPFRGVLTPEQEKIVEQVKYDIMTGKIDLMP